MNSNDLFDLIGETPERYVIDTVDIGQEQSKKLSSNRVWLIAAIITLIVLLVGCTIAYTHGWFADFFSNRTGEPLSDDQLEYIKGNEQIIQEAKTESGWTVELKSAITDGDTGYILFSITAPEDIDLEASLGRSISDRKIFIPGDNGGFITPGNNSLNNHLNRRRALIVPSTGPSSEELNFCWQDHPYWEADNDGLANTLDYMIEIRCEKMYPERECLLKAPFGRDVTFNVRFIDFTYEYDDPEVREALEEKFGGKTVYFISSKEINSLHKTDVLVKGEWEFNINFGMDDAESIELISEPLTVEAIVHRKIGNETMFYETSENLEQVRLISFRLTSFGAQLIFEEDEDMTGVFIEYQHWKEYEDRFIYVIMKDGSQIALNTDGMGTVLTAYSPIVLSEVDYVLLGDGTKLG